MNTFTVKAYPAGEPDNWTVVFATHLRPPIRVAARRMYRQARRDGLGRLYARNSTIGVLASIFGCVPR